MIRECPHCLMNRVSTEDAWEQCHHRQRELVQANRQNDDLMRIAHLLAGLLALMILAGCGAAAPVYITPAPAGTVTPGGNNQVLVIGATTRAVYTVNENGSLTP